MEEKIKHRLNRLKHLGYSSFHIKLIIREAIGTDHVSTANATKSRRVLSVLEKYEKLGSTYVTQYSK